MPADRRARRGRRPRRPGAPADPAAGGRAGLPPAAARHRRPGARHAARDRPRRRCVEALVAVDDLPAGYFGVLRVAVGTDGVLGAGPAPGQRPRRPQPRRAAARAVRRRRRAGPAAARPAALEPRRPARAALDRPGRADCEGHVPRPVRAQARAAPSARRSPRPTPWSRPATTSASSAWSRRPRSRSSRSTTACASSTWSTSPAPYDEALHAAAVAAGAGAVGQAVLGAHRRRARAGLRGLSRRRAGHGHARRCWPARCSWRPTAVVVVHQEHRSSSQRTSGMEPLLVHAPRADVVALLTPVDRRLAARASSARSRPRSWSMPNPLPQGFAPRSLLDSRTIVAAGRLVMEKQFTKLVHAFGDVADQLPGWRLRILGQGHQRPHLVRETRKRGLWDRVELPGTTHRHGHASGPGASICALTSRAEGFPLGLQEAMAAGVPGVSFDCASGPREIVRHEVNGLLVAPESIAGMSAALLRLGTDDDLRHRLGDGALATAAEWDADAIAARWVSIFEAAIERRAGRPRYAALSARPAPEPPVPPAYDATGVTPADARGGGPVAWPPRARTAAADEWLVVPPHETGRAGGGAADGRPGPVPARARGGRRAVLPLACATRPPTAGTSGARPVAELATDLLRGRTSVVALEPWPHAAGPDRTAPRCSGRAAPSRWSSGRRASTEHLVAPRRNRYTQRLPRGAATVTTPRSTGHAVPTLPLMAEPDRPRVHVPGRRRLTWVDGRDPAWNQSRLRPAGRAHRDADHPGVQRAGAVRLARRAALLAAQRAPLRPVGAPHPPGHRRPGAALARPGPPPGARGRPPRDPAAGGAARPSTRTRSSPRCTRCPASPSTSSTSTTTSSSAARWDPEAFFNPAGLAAVWLSPNPVGLDQSPDAAPYLKAAWNNRRLLQEAFGVRRSPTTWRTRPTRTGARCSRRSSGASPPRWPRTARSPFRSDTDLSMLSSLAQHYGLLTGRAVRRRVRARLRQHQPTATSSGS